jgi:deazaflavin-dependent oxidoreductase (nitroreductase family)
LGSASIQEVINMVTRHPGKPGLKTRYQHWADARSVRVAAWLLRRTNGRIIRPWHRRVLLLTTRGRRSGLLRTVPLQYFPDDHDMVVVAANGGMPNHPGWYFNLMAHPDADVEIYGSVHEPGGQRPERGGRKIAVRAVELSAEEAAACWPRVLQIAPQYAKWRNRTDRVIPLLRLIPVQKGGPERVT